MKKFLLGLVLLGAVCVGVLVSVALYAGCDIPAPDTSDLALARPAISPEENGYTYFAEVTNALYTPTKATLVTDYLDGKAVDAGALDHVIAQNDEAVRLINEGLRCGVCLPPEVTGFDTLLPYLAPWRAMGRVLAVKTRRDRLAGEYAEAVEACGTLLGFGDRVQKDAGCLIDYLVGIAVLDLGLTQAQDLARDGGVPPESLARLGEALAAVGPCDEGLVRALKVEYRTVAGVVDEMGDGKLDIRDLPGLSGEGARRAPHRSWLPGYLFQPNRTKLLFAEFYRDMIRNAPLCYAGMDRQDTAATLGLDTSTLRMFTRPNAVGSILCRLLLPALDGILERKCRIEGGIAGTRLVVALNGYRAKEGRLPDDVQGLVPAWLSSVPNDPFDGKPFRFARAAGIVYSVGIDLTDSGGSANRPGGKGGAAAARQRWDAEDAVFQVGGGVEAEFLEESTNPGPR